MKLRGWIRRGRLGLGSGSGPKLSLVVIAYNMTRELPRTLLSLSPAMQSGVSADDYEVILIDNGSTSRWDDAEYRRLIPKLRILRIKDAMSSPVVAINKGLELAEGDLVGVWIDGARIASPGLLATALSAARLHARPLIGTLGFHLGPDVQMRSVANGYNQAREDRLLASVDWEEDAYRLFQIASFAGSSSDGWLQPVAESNALFLTRAQWTELGGFDPAFRMPGGGLCNLDVWRRACAMSGSQVIMLLGEATFHQVHGGVATNAARSRYSEFHEEYKKIRGESFVTPQIEPLLLGRAHTPMLPSLVWSAQHALTLRSDG